MTQDNEHADREMLLAEFSALRAEMTNRQNLQWNVFALQVTAAGVIFSFALSNSNRTGFLLILPVITYAHHRPLFKPIPRRAKYGHLHSRRSQRRI